MQLRCLGIRDETADVRTWIFETASRKPVRFQAGQAITLLLAVDGETLRRTFSIASSAARAGTIELTVKAHEAGRATRWMRASLRPGAMVQATTPFGHFVLPDTPTPLALISAGSGATPLMSMLRTLADSGADAWDIAWIHAARTPADILFGADLTALQRSLPGLAVSLAVTRSEPGWFGYRGPLNRRLLSVMLPDLGAREVLCCGPAGFMDAIRRIHAAEGGDAARFRIEHFVAALPLPPPPAADVAHEGYTITLGSHRFTAHPAETILQAAERERVVIPIGCGGGMCGTCRIRLHEGQVEMHHHGGLLPTEEAAGWILACSSRPRSDLVLEA